MKYELVKLGYLSGNKASVYGVWFEDLNHTSFESFLNENKNEFKSELSTLLNV